MRCSQHPSDLSAAVGVCASCLRERLLLAQTHAHHRLNPDPPPPPLEFPRSVSPYVARRNTQPHQDDASWAAHHLRFYSTPQVGPAASDFQASRSFKTKNRRFSILSSLFRSRSEKLNSDLPESVSSSSWINAIFPVRRRNPRVKVFYAEESASDHHRRSCKAVNRGMSPAREEEWDEGYDWTPERSSELRKTPMAAHRGKGHSRQVSGFAFCLSPLVRPSPNRHWSQKAGLPPDLAVSGEIRGPVKPHLATAASYCANRSRKLADFGRVKHNR